MEEVEQALGQKENELVLSQNQVKMLEWRVHWWEITLEAWERSPKKNWKVQLDKIQAELEFKLEEANEELAWSKAELDKANAALSEERVKI